MLLAASASWWALSSCSSWGSKAAETKLRQQLQGRWLQYLAVEQSSDNRRTEHYFNKKRGYTTNSFGNQLRAFAFTLDSVEFYSGIYTENHPDSARLSGIPSLYHGNWAQYKLSGDSIWWEGPADKKWQLLGTIRALRNDSLMVEPPSSVSENAHMLVTYRRECYKKLPPAQPEAAYDEIAFGVSGQRPSSLVFSRMGTALYQSPSPWVGLCKGRLTPYQRDVLFGKFELVDTATAVRNTGSGMDGFVITSCLIRNHRIVAEFRDWALSGASELVWAYVPARSMPQRMQWTQTGFPVPFATNLLLETIVEPDGNIGVTTAESAYLFAELAQSPPAAAPGALPDTVRFWRLAQRRQDAGPLPGPEVKCLLTNGRYYRFLLSNNSSKTYDLGYDFIARNGLRRNKEKKLF